MLLLGKILGWMIVIGYLLAVSNYFVKYVNRKVIMGMPKDSPVRIKYLVYMRFMVSYHRFFALFTILSMITHLVVQYLYWGLYLTGVIAASLLVVQGLLGAYGHYMKKKKSGPWLYAHRAVAILLFVVVIFHIVTAKFDLITFTL